MRSLKFEDAECFMQITGPGLKPNSVLL
jgi:hypothetical protein